FGILLRNRRASLPDTGAFSRQQARWQGEISEGNFKSLDYLTKRNQLANIEPAVQEIVAKAPASISEADRSAIEAEVRQQLTLYKANLDKIRESYESFIRQLNLLDGNYTELIRTTEAFESYIDERIL